MRNWISAVAILLVANAGPLDAASDQPIDLEQFVYVLRVAPSHHDEATWTDADRAAVSAHFQRLKAATDAGQVILAGRTGEPLDQTFGLVVFEAKDQASAREFMQADPAVMAGVMTATLHPYRVALLRE